jgi:hypothetical protein
MGLRGTEVMAKRYITRKARSIAYTAIERDCLSDDDEVFENADNELGDYLDGSMTTERIWYWYNKEIEHMGLHDI